MAVAAESDLQLEPTLADARQLARQGNVVPVRARFIDDTETPVSAFLKLRAGEPEGAPCFLLESAEQGQVGRYSFVGLRPRAALRWSDGELSEWDGRAASLGGEPTRVDAEPDPYAAVAARFRRRSRTCRPSPVAPSASSASTWCARSSRSARPTPTSSACPTWR